MTGRHGAVIIGGGPNALAAAWRLATQGLRPLVLEQRPTAGGGMITEEFHPGFRAPRLSHVIAPLAPAVVRAMRLESHGLEWLERTHVRAALHPDGRALVFANEANELARSLAQFSAKDAAAYPEWYGAWTRVARAVGPLIERKPTDIDKVGLADLWTLASTGRRFKQLSREDAFRLLRWPPMPIPNLVGEWFETPLLQAGIAARASLGVFAGPQEAGTTANLLLDTAARQLAGTQDAMRWPKGGPGAVTAAMAAAAIAAGAEIRTGTRVVRILTSAGKVEGVALEGGDEIRTATVVSAVDPRQTLLDLVDPLALDPELAWRVGNIRMRGTLAKVNLAVAALPAHPSLWHEQTRWSRSLPTLLHVGPDLEYLERAFDAVKYHRLPAAPWLEVAVPSLIDDTLAPAGAHVMSIYVHHVPPAATGSPAVTSDEVLALVMKTLAVYFPDLASLLIAADVITPDDLQRGWQLTGGHIFHGEHALDQLHLARPLLGMAGYRTPIDGLYLGGAGTHPGSLLVGLAGELAAREVLRDRRPAS